MPLSETAVMVSTVAVVVATSNLAIGVAVGVVVACVLFARRVAHLVEVTTSTDERGRRVYAVRGAMFFASSNDLVDQFTYADDPAEVVLDLSAAQVWDASTVATLDAITHKYATRGKTVEIVGLDEPSLARFQRHTGQLGAGH